MNIEICTPNSATTKDKGDLLEKLCKRGGSGNLNNTYK